MEICHGCNVRPKDDTRKSCLTTTEPFNKDWPTDSPPNTAQHHDFYPKTCYELLHNQSGSLEPGVYNLYPIEDSKNLTAYCDKYGATYIGEDNFVDMEIPLKMWDFGFNIDVTYKYAAGKDQLLKKLINLSGTCEQKLEFCNIPCGVSLLKGFLCPILILKSHIF